MSQSRAFDIVIYGATGYTGELIAEYLMRCKESVKLAVAGRSKAKLETLVTKLSKMNPEKKITTLVANANDMDSLKKYKLI